MQTIFLLFVAFLSAVNLHYAESKRLSFEEIREALQPIKKLCIERTRVDPKLVEDANKGKWVPERRHQCYYKCILLMTKAMKNDEIMAEQFVRVVETMLLEELVDPVMNAMVHCAPIATQPLEACELAYSLAKCFYDYDPAMVIYP